MQVFMMLFLTDSSVQPRNPLFVLKLILLTLMSRQLVKVMTDEGWSGTTDLPDVDTLHTTVFIYSLHP